MTPEQKRKVITLQFFEWMISHDRSSEMEFFDWMGKFRGAYAHELAEKIRGNKDGIAHGPCLDRTADLIDFEVQI